MSSYWHLSLSSRHVRPRRITRRVGRGSNTRNSGTNLNATGTGQPLNGIGQFFTNYSNSNGTPFTLPCNVTQVLIAAQPSTLQLDMVLGCMAQNTDGSTFNDVRVSISSGAAGFQDFYSQQTSSNGWQFTWTDDMGSISLVGTVQGQTFSGNIYYSNQWSLLSDGTQQTPGASGWLSSFSVPVSSLFQYN